MLLARIRAIAAVLPGRWHVGGWWRNFRHLSRFQISRVFFFSKTSLSLFEYVSIRVKRYLTQNQKLSRRNALSESPLLSLSVCVVFSFKLEAEKEERIPRFIYANLAISQRKKRDAGVFCCLGFHSPKRKTEEGERQLKRQTERCALRYESTRSRRRREEEEEEEEEQEKHRSRAQNDDASTTTTTRESVRGVKRRVVFRRAKFGTSSQFGKKRAAARF